MRIAIPCLIVCAFSLSACSGDVDGEAAPADVASDEPTTTDAQADDGAQAPEPQVVQSATAMEERVATIGLLNKRNNVTRDLEMRPGDVIEDGPVILRLSACERTAPWEFPQETGAFVQLDVLERGQRDHTRVFSGWLFKNSPSLNVVEHPIYDVWVKDCAMRFPGDE